MKTFDFELQNEHGLHARPASLLIQTATKFQSTVHLYKQAQQYNGKSMLSVMKMAAAKGDRIRVEASGEDEGLAIDAIRELVSRQFEA
ncbi:MAG: phosphocarrier protein HPr [Clostridiales bacterium]|jgi:phosphocarrier protein|nr:phosphocarrier protein HPr [Clostridiales bacterium]MDN5299278.1 phosphocarrier protein HPr [Clostridiales bacterium]